VVNPTALSALEDDEKPAPTTRAFLITKHSGSRRRTNAEKPPALYGVEWSQNRSGGWDCRTFKKDASGKAVERKFIGYLGKRKLAQMRATAANRAELRALVKEWVEKKKAEKGID